MLRFSANLSLLFTELPLIERFAAARAAGFTSVEIQFPYELSIVEIQQALEINDQELVLINIPVGDLMTGGDGLAGVPGQELAFRRAVGQALHYAEQLSVRYVNVLAGRQPAGSELLSCLQTLSANLRHACDRFQDIGVSTTLEAINTIDMPGFLIHNIAHMQEMMEAVQHPALRMQFDCYHMAMMGEDVLAGLQENWREIGHIQFADTPGRGAPGSGTLPYDDIFELIRQLPYAGWCGAEYRPGTAGTEASLASWQQWRRSL